MLEFTSYPLETFEVVVQTGGKNAKVKYHFTHMLESLMPFALGKYLTPKGVALVFRESDRRLMGYVRLSFPGLAAEKKLETEELYFDDMYQMN